MTRPIKGKESSGAAAKANIVDIPASLSVKQLADLLHISSIDVIKQLMRNGVMANINQVIGFEVAAALATSFGFQVRRKAAERKAVSLVRELKKQQAQKGKEAGALQPRPPVVTVMGHVDHGKTKLLDAIRKTNVVATEAGGITQHIGAYQVEISGQKITFLDTPGHEAFTAMRARGAQVTDIAILVVAADDGVMPQTKEAIAHAKAAGVPILVAINKIDKPEAKPELVKQQLSELGLVPEDWGGDTIMVPVSARENKGIPDLLENILLLAEMEELKADPAVPATGVVIEARLDKTKGPIATVLVHQGTLKVGDVMVVGGAWGRVKAMFNDAGKAIRKATPSTPVEVLGLGTVPREGDTFLVTADERQAKSLIEKRQAELQRRAAAQNVNLSNILDQVNAGNVKELNVILKTDVQGSIEPIRNSLEQLSTDKVKVKVIHTGTGTITESDVLLAIASKGIIIGFNAEVETGARHMAEQEGISIRNYNIIYTMVDDVTKALKGMLEPTKVEVIEGRAEIRAVFPAAKKQKVAGVYVTEGKVSRSSSVRVKRKNQVLADTGILSLRRFKEDVNEVAAGYECGIGLKDFDDYQVGDILEFYRITQST